MAATVTRSSNNSPHTNSMMSSPKDSKRNIVGKVEDNVKREPLHATQDNQQASPPRIDQPDNAGQSDTKTESTTAAASNSTTSTTNAQPLAPPPRPAQNGPTDTPDYFNTVHSTFSLEPNPFEQSFGVSSTETPGRSILPPVASITSPSPLPGITPGWNSLRSGPLSPAMLPGPQGGSDYFGDAGFRGFPTPNESSLRTGLTPGGGGSMFPAPSPNSAALFNLPSAGVTPGTAEFHQSAARAAALANHNKFNTSNGPTSQPPEPTAQPVGMDRVPFQTQQPPRGPPDLFGQHDVSSAANDLLSFASQANGARNNGQFAVPTQPNHLNTNMSHMPGQIGSDQSPQGRRGTKGSLASMSGMSGTADSADMSESGQSEQAKPSTRSRGKKGGNAKTTAASRRKADDTPVKGPANKKAKSNNGSVNNHTADEADSDEEGSPQHDTNPDSGKKMTDEEKRKNFLERNRVAALKCRQRKKQWLANLQAKVELFSTENDALSAQVTQLREEIVNLKTLLLAHKDCPVSQAQGIGGMAMSSFIGDINHHANPYGMAMQPNGMGMPMGQAPGQMQRSVTGYLPATLAHTATGQTLFTFGLPFGNASLSQDDLST